ncbi:hypothetical protein OIE68_45715 [Nocardia vinacea]|uniref:hypothetical protein n=1 Tax=Nocardia vinacea TaxID=96468 RepID=UPI002E136E52|nr:hypothetical protein OIE68_45715 [Nocardia vinacea]
MFLAECVQGLLVLSTAFGCLLPATVQFLSDRARGGERFCDVLSFGQITARGCLGDPLRDQIQILPDAPHPCVASAQRAFGCSLASVGCVFQVPGGHGAVLLLLSFGVEVSEFVLDPLFPHLRGG